MSSNCASTRSHAGQAPTGSEMLSLKALGFLFVRGDHLPLPLPMLPSLPCPVSFSSSASSFITANNPRIVQIPSPLPLHPTPPCDMAPHDPNQEGTAEAPYAAVPTVCIEGAFGARVAGGLGSPVFWTCNRFLAAAPPTDVGGRGRSGWASGLGVVLMCEVRLRARRLLLVSE